MVKISRFGAGVFLFPSVSSTSFGSVGLSGTSMMIIVGEFLHQFDDFLTRLENCHGKSSDWVLCVLLKNILYIIIH